MEMTTDKLSKDLRRERTRKEILKAAAEVFAQKGFHEATIQEIARLAELSAGSLYNYFENKEALFDDLMTDVDAEFGALLDTPPEGGAIEVRLGGLVRTLFRFADDHRTHFRFFMLLYWSGGLSLGRDLGERSKSNQELLGRYVAEMLIAAQASSDLPAQDVESATLLVLSVLHGFGFRWFHGLGPQRLVDGADNAVSLMLHGLLHAPASPAEAATAAASSVSADE